jgi:hypothetical protein
MAEPTQDDPQRVSQPDAPVPLPTESEQRIEEDLLDLRENLERDRHLTRQSNFAFFSLYILVSAALFAGAWLLWQYLHRY